ncbi:MAG: hypothetical protein IT244_09000 [Bacteroidia bacterium]|nr:hypothetical protein [Bacteroidia bacterium]
MKISIGIPIALVAVFAINQACKKTTGPAVDNPYDKVVITKDTSGQNNTVPLPYSIEGLHRNLFKPTCSNSGCHDGTFEPDFRTVQSTYSSMVNQKPIKNDQAGTFNARVVPGNADASILIYRMTVDLGGNSGIMPIVLDPGSTYPTKKDEHLANLRKWINDGAKDFNGNSPSKVDFPPTILGVQALVGNSPLGRGGIYEPLYTTAGGNIDLWFALTDDVVAQGNLSNMKINWSTDPAKYDKSKEVPLVKSGPKTMAGIYNPSVEYNWMYSFNTSGLKKDDVIWFRITMSDGTNTNYELPNDNSMFFLKKYFALKIQ